MHFSLPSVVALAIASGAVAVPSPPHHGGHHGNGHKPIKNIQLGPRPYYLVENLDDGPLKKKLESCTEKNMKPSSWSIGHRGGGTLQFPEHSKESNLAGARMGAGILECDVAFTKDRKLVCRHSQCDLAATTNIVAIPELNAKCTTPFTPATDDAPATAKCCTSDITLAEFKTLCAQMDGFNATATTPEDFLDGTNDWQTNLYATCGTVLSLQDHLELVDSLGLQFTTELKTPEVEMPFEGDYTQEMYAQQMIDAFKDFGIKPKRVWVQSFLYDDILYWLDKEPAFGKQAIYLDETGDTPETYPGAVKNLTRYADDGVRIVAPPLSYLVAADNGTIVPSEYATRANELGLDIITWSLERSPPMARVHEDGDYYYTPIEEIVRKDGDIYRLVDVLWREIRVLGLFSDWSATASFYANCFKVGL